MNIKPVIITISSAVILTLSGCASIEGYVNEKRVDACTGNDWYQMGVQQGRDALGTGTLQRMQSKCAKVNIPVDEARWRAGYLYGLNNHYCTERQLFNKGASHAKNGHLVKNAADVCPSARIASLDAAYHQGWTATYCTSDNLYAIGQKDAKNRSSKPSFIANACPSTQTAQLKSAYDRGYDAQVQIGRIDSLRQEIVSYQAKITEIDTQIAKMSAGADKYYAVQLRNQWMTQMNNSVRDLYTAWQRSGYCDSRRTACNQLNDYLRGRTNYRELNFR